MEGDKKEMMTPLWEIREGFPEEVTPALGFERWVEVQSEGLPSVCTELGFGDFQQLE